MIKVSVMYPNEPGSSFNVDYYLSHHRPLCLRLLAPAIQGFGVDRGLGGGLPGSPAPYHAIGHLTFESVDSFMNSFMPHAGELMADIPNYTGVQPSIQISEVVE